MSKTSAKSTPPPTPRTKDDVLRILREDNPSRQLAPKIAIYADAFLEYQAAQANIDEHGAVVFHPRTGAPIDNPFIRVRNAASKLMLQMRVNATRLWAP